MKLNELMARASAGYPDGLEMFYDEESGEPLKDASGDTLAKFVVIEISETFDPDCTDEEQVEEAIRVMSKGVEELQSVVDALRRTKENSDSELVKGWELAPQWAKDAKAEDARQEEEDSPEGNTTRPLAGPEPAQDSAAPLPPHFTDRELATVLHALRMLQEYRENREPGMLLGCFHEESRRVVPHEAWATNSCDHFEDCEPLTVEEIDTLCESINLAPTTPISPSVTARALLAAFPWLEDEHADVSGADVISQLAEMYRNAKGGQ